MESDSMYCTWVLSLNIMFVRFIFCVQLQSIHFSCYVIFCCMTTSQFIYLRYYGQTSGCFQVWTTMNNAANKFLDSPLLLGDNTLTYRWKSQVIGYTAVISNRLPKGLSHQHHMRISITLFLPTLGITSFLKRQPFWYMY